MAQAPRQGNGQFGAGHSGNPYGRPPKQKPDHSIPARNRRAVFEIAEREVEFVFEGKIERMSYFQASFLRVAAAAVKGDVRAAMKFIETVNRTAEVDLARRLSSLQHIENINALEQENEQLRERTKKKSGVLVLAAEPANPDARLDDQENLPEGVVRRR